MLLLSAVLFEPKRTKVRGLREATILSQAGWLRVEKGSAEVIRE
jgi:hypothetical protein